MKLKALVLVATIAAVHTFSAHATTVLYKNFDNLVDESDHVVGGTIVDTTSTKHQNGEIYTVVTLGNAFLVTDAGTNDTDRPVKIRFKGGSAPIFDDAGEQIGEEGVRAHGAPEFTVGKKVVLFVSHNGKAEMPIHGWKQGFFYINDYDEIVDADGNPIVGFDGADIVRGTLNGPVPDGKPPAKNQAPKGKPTITDSDGGRDTILPEQANARAKRLTANNVPVHVSNFLSMVQERKAIGRTIGGQAKDPAGLFDLPTIDANANKHVRINDDLGTPGAPVNPPEPPASRSAPNDKGE